MNSHEETRREISRRLISITRPVLPPLLFSTLSRVINLLCGIAMFAFGAWSVGAYMRGDKSFSLGKVAIILVFLALLKALFRYIEQFSGHWVAFRCLAILRGYYYDRLEPQVPSGVGGLDSGDLLSRVTKDIDRIEVFFAHTFAPVVSAFFAPLIALCFLGVEVAWSAVLVLAPFLILIGFIVPFFGARSTENAARTVREKRGQLTQHITDSIQGIREVLAFDYQNTRLEEMHNRENQIAIALKQIACVVVTRRALIQFFAALQLCALMWHAGHLIEIQSITQAQLGLYIGIAVGCCSAVFPVEEATADLDETFAAARRVFSITERPLIVRDPKIPTELNVNGSIRFSNVFFTYPVASEYMGTSDRGSQELISRDNRNKLGMDIKIAQRDEVLHDVSMTIPSGRYTALVGTSGSGKSTVASLIERMWDVDSGTISIGDTDIRSFNQDRLRSVVAYADQSPYIFNDTVRANLLLARPDAKLEHLEWVCDIAGLTSWLDNEPNGLDTQVGEMGERLSGGQRQRLCLARTLLREAPITILDEATSQLDPETERTVLAGIREATQGRTLLVIAHRISTITDADQIIVMDRGQVVESGTYAELEHSRGAFIQLLSRENL